MILRAKAPAEDEIEDAQYSVYNKVSLKCIKKRFNFMALFMLDLLPLLKVCPS